MTSEWRECRWGDLATLEYGKRLRGYENRFGPYPVYGTNGPIGWHSEPLCSHPGVIIGRKGAYRGVHYSNKPFFVIDTAFYLESKTDINLKWAYYELLTHDINRMDSGSAIPSTSRDDFYNLPVRVPPLPIQRRIAAILGALDDKIEVNRRINRTLEAMAGALYKYWFVDFGPFQDGEFVKSELGMIPKGWEVRPLSSLIDLLSGGTPRTKVKEYWGGDINWVAAGDVAAAQPFIMSTERTITSLGVQNSSAKILPIFTTIITARGTVGQCGLLPYEMAMNQTNYGIRGVDDLGEFTTYLLIQHAIQRLRQHAYGTVFDTITRKTFDAIPVPKAPANIRRDFENIIRAWFLKMLMNQQEGAKLAVTRNYLLPRLLSGEVPVEVGEEVVGT